MDYKKLFGTIIGVTLFAVLIAGATFAWLTFGTDINEEDVSATNTMNFVINYTKGTNITNIPMVDSQSITPSQAASLVVVMKKTGNSPDGHGSISLTTTSDASTDTITKDGVVRWAICRDTTIESGTQVDDVCGSITSTADFSKKAMNTGKITAKSTIVLLNDAKLTTTKCNGNVTNATGCSSVVAEGGSGTTTAALPITGTGTTTSNVSTLISTTGVSYFIYFWLDGETIANKHKNQEYAGYIHATATQLQT